LNKQSKSPRWRALKGLPMDNANREPSELPPYLLACDRRIISNA